MRLFVTIVDFFLLVSSKEMVDEEIRIDAK